MQIWLDLINCYCIRYFVNFAVLALLWFGDVVQVEIFPFLLVDFDEFFFLQRCDSLSAKGEGKVH